MKISELRQEYARESLDERDVATDPMVQFHRWFDEAVKAELPMVNAMTLATSTPDGRPSARIVLLKDADQNGFVFYTNYESRKGREIAANPHVALLFFWTELEREVQIEGTLTRVTPECDRRKPRRTRGALREGRRNDRRRSETTGAVGWLQALSNRHRILAGPAQPTA